MATDTTNDPRRCVTNEADAILRCPARARDVVWRLRRQPLLARYAALLTTTVMVFAPAPEAMTSSAASGAETTCPPVTLTW